MVKDYLERDRSAAGGLVFIFVTMILALTMIITITFIRASTARSVAESVEHTIALECLASIYTHPDIYDGDQTWTSNHVFESINSSGSTIDPLNQFITVMQEYNLMRSDERAGFASGDSEIFIYMRYIEADEDSNGYPTFEIQIGNWVCFDSWWDHVFKITPSAVKVTIESDYSISL